MPNYDDSNYKKLIAEFDALATYPAVAVWDASAKAELDRLSIASREVDSELDQANEAANALRAEYDGRNLFGKLFGGKSKIQRAQTIVSQNAARQQALEDMAERLDALVAFSPNDADEQKTTLRELKQHKKELQQQKREIAAGARQIRVAARQASAKITPYYKSSLGSHMNASQRQKIRMAKESGLKPLEDEKTALERQLLTVDKRIIWLERFSAK